MHSLELRTLEDILDSGLVRPAEDTVVVAVSGGPDSMALLHVLARLRGRLGIALTAVYVDHGLRPGEIEAERHVVEKAAMRLGIDFSARSCAVDEYARRNKMSLEHAARNLRYQALRAVAADYGAAPVAVAHTADDQAEEILIRLLRGGGRKALSGMRLRSDDIIRPFLRRSKDELLAYLRDRKISFLVDSSNSDMRYLRNRVRHMLLPFLEENFDRGVRRSLCKTADTLAEDEALLETMTRAALEEVVISEDVPVDGEGGRVVLSRAALVDLPAALQRRIVEELLWRVGGRAAYTHILAVLEAAERGRTGTELHLSRGLRIGVGRESLEMVFPWGRGAWRGRLYRDSGK